MNEGNHKQPLLNRIVIGIAVILVYGLVFPCIYRISFVDQAVINLSILPIITWSLLFGWVGGLIIGLFLPFINFSLLSLMGDTSLYVDHSFNYWMIHLFYAVVGIMLGIILSIRQHRVDKVFKKIDTDKRLHYLATHDPLTNLPNRTLLFDRLNHALSVAKRQKTLLGILFFDLDNFKQVNDSCGHATGDKLLSITAERLQSCLRESDTVARIGGDEFVILLEGITNRNAITHAGQKILSCISKPILIGEITFTLSASIGASIYPWDDSDINTLLEHADEAMYHAKAKGYGTISFYGEQEETLRRLYPNKSE